MKLKIKSSTLKEKICENCKLQESCGDLPGFCVLIYYVPIALVVVGLVYLLITMSL
jgi:hypothetical protein